MMDPQGDVAGSSLSRTNCIDEEADPLFIARIAIFVALFDDLHGQILHESSLFSEGVELKGLEFSGPFQSLSLLHFP